MSEPDEYDAYDLSEFTPDELAAIDDSLARAHGGPAIQIAVEDSPFTKFLSWKNHLAVTDLVSPLWCEVQYEYGLYGKRHRPLHQRPPSFTSKSGKHIRVRQQVAHENDHTLKRGKSIHKALEDELYPEKVVVHPVSAEERFGLRLIQLIDGFNQLTINGIARELPVFTITHAQVVLGVIDEVLCLPVASHQGQSHILPLSSPSGSPPMKKQRLTSPVLNSPNDPSDYNEPTETETTYELHIVDHKTRRVSSIPLDQDSLSPRLQLMMYHRMFSHLLEPETFDFNLLWTRLEINPMKPFSTQFLKDVAWQQRQAGPGDGSVHLNRLVSVWISTVERKRPAITGVSRQLKLVYRRSGFAEIRGGGKRKVAQIADIEDPTEAFILQEELDLAQAIQESLGEMEHRQVGQTAQNIEQNASSSGDGIPNLLSPLHTDPTPDCETHPVRSTDEISSRAAANQRHRTEIDRDDPSLDEAIIPKEESVGETSRIIGTREFKMDDGELDAHLVDVLQWWFGARPARGVDVSQTHRCFTCEYQDSCEWREQKARETLVVAVERKSGTTKRLGV